MEPILVALISPSQECVHCDAMIKIWDKITTSLLSVYPKLKFPQHTPDTKQYKYPFIMVRNKKVPSIFPKDLNTYCSENWTWRPMILLIPGDSWNKSLKSNIKLENVQIMNSKLINNVMSPVATWLTNNPDNFGLWLKETLPKVQIKFFPSILEQIKNPAFTKEDNILNIISR